MQDYGQRLVFADEANTSAETPRTIGPISLLISRDRWSQFFRDHWQVICLVVISLCVQMYILSFADQLIYDEHYWVPEARHILGREPLDWAPYQPALSKLFIASGIYILGDNQLGWRIPSALFGIASIALIYLIARRLAGKRTALLASLLFTTENLVFTSSGLAMLDGFAVAFMLLSFLLYLSHRYTLSGLALAVAVVCSPKALLGVFAILAHWFFSKRKRGPRAIGVFAITSVLSFLVMLPITDFIATGQWLNPFHRIVEMWTSNISLEESFQTVAHPTAPWWWILDPRGLDLAPVEFNYRFKITPTIWILIIPSMAYLLYRQLFVKERRNTPGFILLWFSATYLLWIPLELYSDRPMYLYYLLPTMGAICIAVAYGMDRTWQQSVKVKDRIVRWSVQALLILYLLVHVGVFFLLSPLTAPLGLSVGS